MPPLSGEAPVSEPNENQPLDLGVFARTTERGRVSTPEIVALALSVFWLVAVGLFVGFADLRAEAITVTNGVMTFLAVFLPIALIWGAATTARTVRELRQEAARLQGAVDAMRHAYVQQSQAQAASKPALERKLEEIAAAQRQTEAAVATFASRRDGEPVPLAPQRKAALTAAPRPPAEDEPALALGTPAEALRPPISVADFIRALNFPETADDKEGFRALRAALEDRSVAKLVRAAQDVLTLLAQDGIFMDDLKPDRPRAELWRRFAEGQRGRAISGLGGVKDRSSLALTAGRMRSDPVFRDAAHHFLRQFDRSFQDFEKNASDQDLSDFADSRTARAFMLLGRVTGICD